MTGWWFTVPFTILLFSFPLFIKSSEDLGELTDDWSYRRNLLTFTLAGNDAECFHDRIEVKQYFYTSFTVMKPQGSTLSFSIQSSNNTFINSFMDQTSGNVEQTVNETDTFSFCFLNFGLATSTKVVEFYLMTMGASEEKRKEREKDDDYTVKKSLAVINRKTLLILNEQAVVQMENSRDMTQAEESKNYIQMWAMFHIFLFIGTAVSQVFFVKHLFKSPSSSSSRGA